MLYLTGRKLTKTTIPPFFCLPLLLLFNFFHLLNGEYEIGVGIADVTGPITEINFMGYGKFDQQGTGLHLRQWARSYIISDGKETIAFVSVDVGMIGDGLRIKVIEKLQGLLGEPIYNLDNVIISGTHTHSAPGGFLLHFLFDLPIRGFSRETFGALVNGIVQSIHSAHRNKRKGRIFLNRGDLFDANINRSPSAYLENPEWERAMYKNNTDTEMVQLKFVSSEGEPIGVINWFPVHPTSMNNSNTLVSSDNVGYASVKFEQAVNRDKVLGRGPFVASFASTNLGDVSPNTRGPKCQRTGLPCDAVQSSCSSANDVCIASGPGKDMFESTAIIADRLFRKAWEIWQEPSPEEVTGPIKVVHQYVDMSKAEAEIETPQGEPIKVKGCAPAMGYSFAAGTVDGPGAFSFRQGTLSTNPMWNFVRNVLAQPTDEDVKCHAPKPILLATGRMVYPFDWQPRIVSTQLALLGDVALVAVPGEFTTMSGRRMKGEMVRLMEREGFESPTAIIAGLSNTYSDYITTFEEYQVQRYEGASTIFGPHTLTLYLHQYRKLLEALLKDERLDRGPQPQGLFSNKLSFILPVVFDLPSSGHNFGSVLQQPANRSRPGDMITVKFVSGNPRNDLMHGRTYFQVERLERADPVPAWKIVATDANWETKMKWKQTNRFLGNSQIEIEWSIPEEVEPGTYRIRHFGHYKHIFGGIRPYEGATDSFEVLPS